MEAAGGIAAGLPDHLKAAFRENFEKGMAAYRVHVDGETMGFQRELAAYCARFTPGGSNVYLDLIRALGVKRVIYSSLNYDLLFEQAAAMLGFPTVYADERGDDRVRLLKLHGSCNFWPAIPSGMFEGLRIMGEEARADVVTDATRILTQVETVQRCASDNSFAPAIAIFAEGKAVRVNPDYVERQRQSWRLAVARAKRVFIGGVRVHPVDDHIWGVLARTKAPIHYFGLASDKDAFEAWAGKERKARSFFIEADFAKSISIMRSCMP